MDNSDGMSFSELLAQPGVTEFVELRSAFGFMAFHGGPVERVTSLIAHAAAAASDASVYSIDQPADRPLHIPSTRVTPDESTTLAAFYGHVRAVCCVHGYGREKEKQHVLIGGRDRDLAEHIAGHLRKRLDDRFPVISDLNHIPKGLRGVHSKNPANIAAGPGVQLELPPALRWNWDARTWADEAGHEPTRHVRATIDALADAATTWPLRRDRDLGDVSV